MAGKTSPAKTTSREAVAARLRKICLALPESSEGVSFGNLAFRAGKRPFVVLDRYKGVDCIFLYVDPGQRETLLKDKRFFPAPYDPKEKGVCRSLEKIDWAELKALIVHSYRSVAIARMLRRWTARRAPRIRLS